MAPVPPQASGYTRSDERAPDDPAFVEPSPVSGLSRAAFEDKALDLLEWNARPLAERLRAHRRHARQERLLQRLGEASREG